MCYRLYGQDTLTSSTWDNAYRVCKGNGAEMVTIDDYFTNKNVGDFASVRNTNKFWTGMSEKGVTTQNGIATTWNMKAEASIYQGRWSVRNPDTTFGDCVYIEKKDGDYVWTVGSCLMKMAFMCQRTSCLPQSFHCDNGRCVNSNWRCDGVDDCGDFSDEVECAGRCSYLLDTANSGRIQSPNHPSNYQPSRVCTWTIVGPEGSNIYLEFTSFNTEKDTDIVEVLIGGRTESTARSVARLSGQPSLSTARYRSYNNYMIIRFSTDSQTEKVGFTANYNSSRDSYPEELYMTARTTVNTLEPPLFSSHGSNAYLGNRDYVWIIRAEERRKIVTLERMKIDLMGDDVIEIRDGDSGSAPLLEKYTASNNDNVDLPLSQSEPIMGKRFVFSTSNVMYVIMRTSGSTSGTGFSFQYRQGCVARYTADAGEITSPGYPNVNYANFQTCTWTIDIPSGKGVKVMLDRSKGFEIADNEDFIEIYTNSTDDSGIAAHGSGAGFTTISLSNDQPFHSPNGKMFIRFKSTAITNKKGFRFLYSVDCPDPGLTEASEMNPSQTALQLRQFDNEFTISCKNGYGFHSDELNLRTARMKCMYGGKWLVEQRTRSIPQCKPNYCGEPGAVENGYISHSSGVVFGSFVTFTCFPGFSLLGSANITCQANQWTSRPQCVSANCPAPPTISNGQFSSSSNQYAAIVNYTCNAGYQLIGAPILFCQSTGQWTASAPECIKTTCPIPAIKNGRVSSSTLPKFQETLTVTCDVGYIVNGSATITCGDDRNFDAVPNCIDQNECDTTNGGCSQNCMNTEGSFYCTCNAGYKLNADKRQCDDIIECTADSPKNGGCSQVCTNSVGSYTCSCNQPGYVLFDVDGRSGYTIQSPDDGNRAGDVYHLGHSCVRRNCSEPSVVNNAMLMTKRAMHRYKDKITYTCDLGYVKSRGEETFTCGSDGQWTPSQTTNLLECSVATCPVSDLNTLNLKNRPTLSTTNPVSYLDYLNMTCNVQGKGTFVNQQQCLYDKTTNTYALYGAPYECGVIDCGNPVKVPGSSYSTTPSPTTYGATFTFTCENLQTRKGSSSTTNDSTVTCMDDGNWDFGTLRCEGTTCTDPGYPNGGYLSTDVTGFEQDKVVTFGCNLAGFTVPANSALKCVLNGAADGLTWNGTTPTECQDTTAPVVSGCPDNMNFGRYTVITHNRPIVSDNSRGIKTFEVSPRNANTTLVLEETPITITYTATDFNGNQDSCSFIVNVADEEPPKVTCPSAKTETVVDTEVRTLTLNPGDIVSSDNSGQAPTVEISPQSLTISASFIGTTREITVTARDSTGRTDQCRVQVYTAAAACSPLSLEKPLFGQKNCSATDTGYRCDLKCDQTYTFYDTPGQDVIKTLQCTNGGAWPQRIPACTPETQEALYTSLITVTYGVETAGQTIGSSCFDSSYKSVLSTQTPQTESNLKQGCSGGLFINDNIFIDIDEESSFATSAVTLTSTSLNIIYTVRQTPLVYTEVQYSTCSDAVLNRMKSFDISISKIQSTVGGCPNLVRTSASENSKGFICSSEKKKVTVNGKDYCLDCPAGTYPSAPDTCDLCPVNTYKGISGSSACTQCGSGGTQRTGSTSQGQCQAKCAAGTFSDSGMPPCNQCAKNSYWNNSTSCTACPNEGKTSSAGAVSVGSCINKCSAGSYSYDGYAPCRSCPKNYYQDQTGATSCTRCPNTQYTASIGSPTSSSCQNAMDLCSGQCLNGGICVAQDNEAICNCPIGYYGSRCENRVNYCIQGACYNGGTCVSGATSYTCTCPSGTTGARCETDATDDCATAPCKNGGMCVNQLYNYRCLCTSGYSGTTCSSQTSKCNEQPCNSVGTAECINYDNIRRICKCKAGYTGQDCETNIDDCASNPCLYGGTCTDLVGGYSCTCPTGYQGTRCQNRVNPCSLNRCSNGQCVDAYSMDLFKCICQPGYQYGLICPYEMYNGNGTSLTPFSTPIGTTTIGNCHQQCDNLQICQAYTFAAGTCKLYQTAPTDPTITAAAGSTLNIKKCIYPDDDYWSPWYDQGPPNGGSEAEKRVQLSTYGVNVCNGTEPIDAECRVVGSKVASSGTGDTFTLPCGVDGIECTDQVNNPCEDYEVRYKCPVYKGFQSNTCDVKNHCLSNPCMNGGACSYSFNDFVCSCPNGYTGKLCQHDFDSCQTNPCRQGGTCIDRPGSQGYECQCPAGYGGSICQSNINECSSNPCDPVGSFKCSDAVNDYVCDCKPGYTGKNCSTEINECDAEPCMHGGNCTDRVNDFQCTCPEGWTGKRCEMIYDECTVNNKCPSSSQCLNIFKKSYCKCPKNTYGEVCENSPDICRDLGPCLNSAVCTAGVNALSKCTCPNDDYRGIGCEIMVNHCGDPNKCENGGTCVNLAPGFRCDCPSGYAGANCSINVNDCTDNCPSTSTCIDMVNAHYCRCPLGKTGESCARDLDTNYDLYFYLTSQDGYAALPYPIYLSGSSFSLSVWVRFYQSSLTGTFMTIFTAKSANSLASVTKFLSLDHQGLVVYDKNGQNPQRAAYQQQTVTDGQWNYVVVSWNKDNGFDLVVNSLRQSQIPTTPYTSVMAQNVWVTLGANFDSTIVPKVNVGFRGYVSQLNIYNRRLSFENEIPQLIPDPRKVFSGSILHWNEFVYHRGVKVVYPSSAQKPCTEANCLVYNKKFPTFRKSCTSNVYKVSADRLTSVTWTEPIPEGATIQESTYKSGDTFSWGKYTNIYALHDAANSSTFCSFNIYVIREQCPNPDPPHLGRRTCERSYNPYFGCSIGCTDANRRIDRYTPKVYTCGPSGAWNPSNRNIPLRFPSCGLVQSIARRRLMVEIAYPNISATFCDTLALKLREALTSVNTRWSSQICSQPDCSDMTVDVNCLVTPTSVKMIIPTSKAILTHSNPSETLTVEEIFIRSVLESRLFDFSMTIPNGSPDLNSFTTDSFESCPNRQSVVDGYCVKCGPGNFFNSSTLICEDCPVGTYQDQDDQTSCTPCPQGSTTQTVASPSSSDCKASSSATNEDSAHTDNEIVYYIIGLSFTGVLIILLVTIVCIFRRRNLKLVKEMHSLHYVKTVDSSALQQQIDANDGTQYQELEENHYDYLTPGYENSQL